MHRGFMNLLFFKQKERIPGERIDLVVIRKIKGNAGNNYIPSVLYHIVLHDTDEVIGNCDLRIGMDEELYYAGNIGYRINTPWRGHSYAYDASLLMMRQARDVYHMDSLLITCSPDNPASKRTLQKLSGTLLETVDVPAWHWLYKRGETVKEIYRYQLV